MLSVNDKSDLVTITQLKEMIANYKPLKQIQPRPPRKRTSSNNNNSKKSQVINDFRNLLIITNCTHDKLDPLIDAGVIEAIEHAVLGTNNNNGSNQTDSNTNNDSNNNNTVFERVCFADINKAFPPPPRGADSFESDFS